VTESSVSSIYLCKGNLSCSHASFVMMWHSKKLPIISQIPS